jgi:hypothetical protein
MAAVLPRRRVFFANGVERLPAPHILALIVSFGPRLLLLSLGQPRFKRAHLLLKLLRLRGRSSQSRRCRLCPSLQF